jgi:hypothetical protein
MHFIGQNAVGNVLDKGRKYNIGSVIWYMCQRFVSDDELHRLSQPG